MAPISSGRQHHCEIEKRRRDKMNFYIGELASLIPLCGLANRKMDKLTILRLAVEHVRSIQGESIRPDHSLRGRRTSIGVTSKVCRSDRHATE